MAKKLKIGIIGMSEGNGHPYSWSAIFNGYNEKPMHDCPFPAIPEYLADQNFPEDSLGNLGEVTHIWTQDLTISKHIAAAAKIKTVVENSEDMIGEVDAILLARDDAENHYKMALPFLKVGLPIFIDKPLALSVEEAKIILKNQQYKNQVFSCSSIRFAQELQLNQNDKNELGKIIHVEASVPKKWDTYAVHVIDPLISQLPERGDLFKTIPFIKNGIHHVMIEWENISAYIKVTGKVPVPIKLEFFGEKGVIRKEFKDSFNCFKKSLHRFVNIINDVEKNIYSKETLEIIEILERGRS